MSGPGAPPPSGRQHTLAAHGQQLVVVEVGGGIRRYRAGGRDVLDGYPAGSVCDGARGQLLAPWPNRLEDGSFEWRGRRLQAPLSEVEARNAIHGLVRWSAWALADATDDTLVLGHRLHPQPGWDWTLDLEVTYRLGPDGLTVSTAATNLSDEACPFGLGWHPYLAAPGGSVDELLLTVPAATVLRSDARGLPAGRHSVVGTREDFNAGRLVGPDHLDVAFTDLARGGDGRAVVSVEQPGGGAAPVRLWMEEPFGWVMVYTGDTLPDPARRRRGLAVEPMTCPPNMLRSGDGMAVLEPGGRVEASWGLS
jgi:aldose 1-epimerase